MIRKNALAPLGRTNRGCCKSNMNKLSLRAVAICFLTIAIFPMIPAAFSQKGGEGLKPSEEGKVQEAVDQSRLRDNILQLQALGNRTSWDKQWQTANWLSQRFKTLGLDCEVQEYEANGKRWPNVIAEIKGQRPDQEAVILCAHLDSIAYNSPNVAPGANDNGSGVAVILEVANLARWLQPKRSIMFCLFSNEEQGQLGSKAYVSSLKEGRKIKAVINMDVVGYSRPSNIVEVEPISTQQGLRGKSKGAYRMLWNLYFGISYPKQALLVAGRPANAELVKLVAGAMEERGDLKVRPLIGKDCG
jgi:hypothetical protein